MPDKKREEFFTNLFLQYYNAITGKQYVKVGSPEDRRDNITGTYEFLCKETNSKSDYLAIEEKSLNKSKENVRDNKEIREIKSGVERILEDKHILVNKEYRFLLEFKNVPGKNERDRYVSKIAESIEKAMARHKGCDICDPVTLNIGGYDCIKEFRLISVLEGKGIVLGSSAESSESTDVEADTSERMAKIFENSNKKLDLPTREGKKTILLITNDWDNFVGADQYNVVDAMEHIDRRNHEHIDEIFFINKRNLEDGYDIHKVK